MRTFIFIVIFGFIFISLSINLDYTRHDEKSKEITKAEKTSITFSKNDEDKEVTPLIETNDYQPNGKYHYTLTISNVQREWETYETQEMINGEIRLRKTSPDISYLNGTYDWYSDIYLPDENAMFNYICNNYSVMKNYKISSY